MGRKVENMMAPLESECMENWQGQSSAIRLNKMKNSSSGNGGCFGAFLSASYSINKIDPLDEVDTNTKSELHNAVWNSTYDQIVDYSKEKLYNRNSVPNDSDDKNESSEEQYEKVSRFEQKPYLEIRGDHMKKRRFYDYFPSCIIFTKKDVVQCGFEGKLIIKNLSHEFVTFHVASSNAAKFCFLPEDIGWLPPRGLTEVTIRTNRMKVTEFPDIASEMFFIQCTPIYSQKQLDMNSLNILWKAFGTEMFPIECMEEYVIRHIVPYKQEYLESLSMLGQMMLAPFFQREVDTTTYDCKASISERTFYENWPGEDDEFLEAESKVIEGKIEQVVEASNQAFDSYKIAALIFFGTLLVGFGIWYTSENVVNFVEPFCIWYSRLFG